ncbi:MAG: NADP-dependent malic enzyme [Firmicutes bacterium]|nr:NADP-dependent malic enzyme [Bacillota bacterium]
MADLEKALRLHEEWRGKLTIESKVTLDSKEALSMAYTPGVAEPCKVIAKDPEAVYKYTMKGNLVAVVTDGTAVLGLGDIGPKAGLPVMEGKCALFKEFGGVDAIPICLDTKDPDEIVETVKRIAPGFGGINLEDISAPRCFYVEERLREELDIPVFHDDQHGTAMVVLAALTNALKVVGKKKSEIRAVVNGAGAAGTAITKLLLADGFGDVTMCDKVGILHPETEGMNESQAKMAAITNKTGLKGTLADALKGADIMVGVSAPHIVSKEMIATMAKDAIVFAMANPVPEIMPEEAKAGGARIVGTGRSDYPNQINNVLIFPGLFKGALAARTKITEEIKLAGAHALAEMIPDDELNEENLIPYAFDPRLADTIAQAVIKTAQAGK